MQTKCAHIGLIAVFLILAVSVNVQAAEELDTAKQMYAAISDGLGHSTVAGLDTTTASYTYVRNAVNAGLRAVQEDMPFTVEDTITLALHTFRYTLNANLVRPDDGKPSGYRVEMVTASAVTGLREATIDQFGAIVLVTPTIFRVEGDKLIVNSWTPTGATLYVYGPGEITPITGNTSLITYPPETKKRWAAVYYAIATIAGERSDTQTQAEYAQKYYEITGKMPQLSGVQ